MSQPTGHKETEALLSDSSRNENSQEFVKASDDTFGLPVFTDGVPLWELHHSYVEEYVKLFYADDKDVKADDDIVRFWHHWDSGGAGLDPCVCKMETRIFDVPGKWPKIDDECKKMLDAQGDPVPSTFEKLKKLFGWESFRPGE